MHAISGLHHVTIIASSRQSTLDFYTGTLGMTMLARTVDFDQPEVLQLYCATPGQAARAVLSFLIHPRQQRGREGVGTIGALSLAVPRGSLPAWQRRLHGAGVTLLGRAWSFQEEHLCFNDPDGLALSLVEEPDTGGGGAAADRSATPCIIRIKGIEAQVDAIPPAARVLLDRLGVRRFGQDGAATRFRIGRALDHAALDLILTPHHVRGLSGAGMVGQVALRVADVATLDHISGALAGEGIASTPIRDRMFFRASYFRAFGGISFALATAGPGFPPASAADRASDHLMLPAWLEPERREIERRLAGGAQLGRRETP